MAEVHWSRPISKEPGNYLAWPTVARTAAGELLVVFSGDREQHVCPYGKTELIRSSDQGESWSEPTIINNTPLDDRDAGLIQLSSGDLVMSSFTVATIDQLHSYRTMLRDGSPSARWSGAEVDAWERHCGKVLAETRERWLGAWTRRSVDGGRSWEPHVDSLVSAPHGPRPTSDGRLVYVGTASVEGLGVVQCVESADDARSWRPVGTVLWLDDYVDEGLAFHEPHVIDFPGGDLLCLMRSDNSRNGLYACRSADGGVNWSLPEATGMIGYDNPPFLTGLADGRLLCTYGRRLEPFGERACLSEDEGRTWQVADEIVLCDAPDTDMGYPATAEISPGELLTVYYQRDRPGEKVCIHATRWSLAGS